MKQKPTIIYEDDYLVVVNKPANYLSIPDRYKPDLPNVQQFLKDKFGDIYTIHRLDRETSGIILFAKDAATHKSLSIQFENREVQKYYLAIASGNVFEDEGKIDKPIAKHQSNQRMIIAKQGKPSLSHYKVIERFRGYTLLEVQIMTGRTHQIRVHLQAIGYPLAVDPIYARKDAFYLSEIKGKKYRRTDEEERPLVTRCTLHAQALVIKHPVTKEEMRFEAEAPKDIRAMLKQLRKWAATL